MARKTKPFKPGFRPLTKLDSKMIQWCINNGIACCVVKSRGFTEVGQEFCVEIIIKGKSNKSIALSMNGKTRILHKVNETGQRKEWFVYNGQAYA